MMVSSLLYYKKFCKVNPYDMCVANHIINGKQAKRGAKHNYLVMKLDYTLGFQFGHDCLCQIYVGSAENWRQECNALH